MRANCEKRGTPSNSCGEMEWGLIYHSLYILPFFLLFSSPRSEAQFNKTSTSVPIANALYEGTNQGMGLGQPAGLGGGAAPQSNKLWDDLQAIWKLRLQVCLVV